MKCQFCGNEETVVKDTRIYNNGLAIKRRRFCSNCNSKFTTIEEILRKEMFVIKKSGNKELFDKFKLKNAIRMGCGKRATEEIVDRVLSNIMNSFENLQDNEITSVQIGNLVLEELRKIDKAAFIRFASVYMNFENESDFEEFMKKIKE